MVLHRGRKKGMPGRLEGAKGNFVPIYDFPEGWPHLWGPRCVALTRKVCMGGSHEERVGCCHAAKGTGGGYQPGVTSPKADSLVRSDRPPRRTASFRSPACTRGWHTARQRESGSAPSAPSKSRPSRIPSLLLTLLRVFPGEADSPATFALDQRSPPQIVRFK